MDDVAIWQENNPVRFSRPSPYIYLDTLSSCFFFFSCPPPFLCVACVVGGRNGGKDGLENSLKIP